MNMFRKTLAALLLAVTAAAFTSCNDDAENQQSGTDAVSLVELQDGYVVWDTETSFIVESDGSWTGGIDVFFPEDDMTVSAGDQIIITHKGNASSGYEWKALQISGLHKWNKMPLTGGNFINAVQRVDQLSDGGTNYLFVPYTLNQETAVVLTEADAAIINDTQGFTIWGAGYTVTKIRIRTTDYSDEKAITLTYSGTSVNRNEDFEADIQFAGYDSIPERVRFYFYDDEEHLYNYPVEVKDGKVKLNLYFPEQQEFYVTSGFVSSNKLQLNVVITENDAWPLNGTYVGAAEGGDVLTDTVYIAYGEECLWKKDVGEGKYCYWMGRVVRNGNDVTIYTDHYIEDSDNPDITVKNMQNYTDQAVLGDYIISAVWSETDNTLTLVKGDDMDLNVVFTKMQ